MSRKQFTYQILYWPIGLDSAQFFAKQAFLDTKKLATQRTVTAQQLCVWNLKRVFTVFLTKSDVQKSWRKNPQQNISNANSSIASNNTQYGKLVVARNPDSLCESDQNHCDRWGSGHSRWMGCRSLTLASATHVVPERIYWREDWVGSHTTC